jgi:translation elongation factor EF-4
MAATPPANATPSKRMRKFGKVEIPQSAFIAALKMGDG